MARRASISVSFTSRQVQFLSSCVASGRYQSTSEVVREAVRLLEDRLAREREELDRIRELVGEGAADLDHGDVLDGETFFAEWDAELDRLDAARRPR